MMCLPVLLRTVTLFAPKYTLLDTPPVAECIVEVALPNIQLGGTRKPGETPSRNTASITREHSISEKTLKYWALARFVKKLPFARRHQMSCMQARPERHSKCAKN